MNGRTETSHTSGDHRVLMGVPAKFTTAVEPSMNWRQSASSAISIPGYVLAASKHFCSQICVFSSQKNIQQFVFPFCRNNISFPLISCLPAYQEIYLVPLMQILSKPGLYGHLCVPYEKMWKLEKMEWYSLQFPTEKGFHIFLNLKG